MEPDFERCRRVVRSRDTRFDGAFSCAVVTTGVSCRPSYPGMPHRRNVRFFVSAAGAQARQRLAAPVGEPTAGHVARRALEDADVFLPADPRTVCGLARLGGLPRTARWRPRRCYAPMHLWTLAG